MKKTLAMHFVCTMKEVKELTSKNKRFWVSNCGCREQKGRCSKSRHDVCLYFNEDMEGSGGKKKEINKEQLLEIISEAENKKLVPRPFRSEDRTKIDGICFCCNDCCAYFLDPSEACDKGAYIESTVMDECTHCEICVDFCYFNARAMKNNKLKIIQKNCYGCGLCVDSCPTGCISMQKRN